MRRWLSALGAAALVGPALAGVTPGVAAAAVTPDPTFGVAGTVVTDFGPFSRGASGLALQGDGRIVVAGDAGGDFGLARYHPDGSLDGSFGRSGRVTTDFGGGEAAVDVALQQDGRVVVLGSTIDAASNVRFAVARYLPDGALDGTFDGDGRVVVSFGDVEDRPRGMALQSDGGIVVVGLATSAAGTTDMAVARLAQDGGLDRTFGGTGKVTIDTGGYETANSVALLPDGRILLAGASTGSTPQWYDFAVARLNPDGSPDLSLDGDGTLTTDFGTQSDVATGLDVQADGRFVVAGVVASPSYRFALSRYLPDGRLDPSFNGNGKVVSQLGAPGAVRQDITKAVKIQPDGRTIVGGTTDPSGTTEVALTRYEADGRLDAGFGAGGRLVLALGPSGGSLGDLALQPDGNILLAGSVVTDTSGNAFATSRLVNDLVLPGYRMVGRDGGVFSFGPRAFRGSTGGTSLNRPIVGGATDPRRDDGYWLLAADGGVLAFSAELHGSLAGRRLTSPPVALAPTPTGRGYWIVQASGAVTAFGDASHLGDLAGQRLNAPIVGLAASGTGNGYWLVGRDGGTFAFGDARFLGSTGSVRLNAPVVDLVPTADRAGYFLVAADGGVFAYGTATFRGSTGATRLNAPIVGMRGTHDGGYWLAGADGGVFAFGAPFLGSLGRLRLNAPVVDLID